MINLTNRMVKIGILVSLLTLNSPLTFAVDNLSKVSISTAQQCSLKYAWAPVAPYVIEDSPEPRGYQIDFIRWLAQELNCKINFEKLTWEQSLLAVAEGRIDLVGRASLTEKRQQWAYFSAAYADEVLVLNLRQGESKKYNNADLSQLIQQGFRLGVVKNAYYGETIEDLRNAANSENSFRSYHFAIDMVNALTRSEIDGFFEAPFILDDVKMKMPETSRFEEYPAEIVTGKIHFMFSKKSISENFINAFNQALIKVKQSQRYKTHQYWSKIK